MDAWRTRGRLAAIKPRVWSSMCVFTESEMYRDELASILHVLEHSLRMCNFIGIERKAPTA